MTFQSLKFSFNCKSKVFLHVPNSLNLKRIFLNEYLEILFNFIKNDVPFLL